jgi:hydrogenase nickel incorporation protein HypB
MRMINLEPQSEQDELELGVTVEPDSTTGRVATVHLCGSPGCGKSTLIEATVRRLSIRAHVGVIVAHLAASRDASMMRRAGAATYAIDVPVANTNILQNAVDCILQEPAPMDLLLIESPGQQINTPIAKVGRAARVAVFSITGGDDKAAEFPDRVREADLVVLTKMDLLSHVRFDLDVFHNDVRKLNNGVQIIELSAECGSGMEQWVDWLLAHSIRVSTSQPMEATPECSEWWFG